MTTKESLYSLVQQANALSQALAESGGELTPELEALVAHLDISIPAKIDGYQVVLDRLDLESAYYKAKADYYAKIARGHGALKDRLKDAIKQSLCALGATEIRGVDSRFVLSTSTPALVIDESRLDKEYMLVTYSPDRERIKKDLKSGKKIAGAELRPSQALRSFANKRSQQ